MVQFLFLFLLLSAGQRAGGLFPGAIPRCLRGGAMAEESALERNENSNRIGEQTATTLIWKGSTSDILVCPAFISLARQIKNFAHVDIILFFFMQPSRVPAVNTCGL